MEVWVFFFDNQELKSQIDQKLKKYENWLQPLLHQFEVRAYPFGVSSKLIAGAYRIR